MPIVCMDERDYWNYYFGTYLNDKKAQETFKIAQEREFRIHYIGNWYNNKDYIEELVKEEASQKPQVSLSSKSITIN
jgi:hypothetical protein